EGPFDALSFSLADRRLAGAVWLSLAHWLAGGATGACGQSFRIARTPCRTERGHYLCRRFGLWRPGMLRASDDPHSALGPHGRRGNAVHPVLFGRVRLHAEPGGVDDGPPAD